MVSREQYGTVLVVSDAAQPSITSPRSCQTTTGFPCLPSRRCRPVPPPKMVITTTCSRQPSADCWCCLWSCRLPAQLRCLAAQLRCYCASEGAAMVLVTSGGWVCANPPYPRPQAGLSIRWSAARAERLGAGVPRQRVGDDLDQIPKSS